MPDDFLSCWTKVRPKGEATLQVQYVIDDGREQSHTVWGVLELTEAALDVICVEDDVTLWMCDAQVVNSPVESSFHLSRFTMQLSK